MIRAPRTLAALLVALALGLIGERAHALDVAVERGGRGREPARALVQRLVARRALDRLQQRGQRALGILHEVRQHLGARREDLLTGLVQAEVEGSKLTHDEMLRMLVLLLVAGNETTTTLIGNAVVDLLAHPAQLQRLRAQPDLMETAVDEVLHYSSPVQLDPRCAKRALELHGHTIEAGQIVVCWIGSANRDEEVFADAAGFDVGRSDNRHIAFGFGPHYCLGANLARLETQVALRVLLQRTRHFERSDDALLPLHQSIVFRAVTSLPVRLEP